MKKIIKFKDLIIKKTQKEIEEKLNEASIEDELIVYLDKEDLKNILLEFYNYYESKDIIFSYNETMNNHFRDLIEDAKETDEEINLMYVLKQLKFYELIDSRLEVRPNDTDKIIKKIYYKCMRSNDNE